MSKFHDLVDKICGSDRRYRPDAYEFIMQGLVFTQDKLKRKTHVSGKELAQGLRDYAVDQYGALASRVLSHWGINQTRDFGEIVYNMIEKKLLSKSEKDYLEDFNSVYDFNSTFSNVLADTVDFNIPNKS